MRKIPNKNKKAVETKTITIAGMLSSDYFFYTSYNTIVFVDENGYKTDLFAKFAELVLNYGNTFTVKIYIANERTSKDDIMTGFVMSVIGIPMAEFEKTEYSYSEWTSGITYTSELNIGGHDLYNELECYINKFCILEIDVEVEKTNE